MAITLTYFGQTSLPVEIEGLTPDWAKGKSLSDIERFEIFHGNQKIPLAELFSVSGGAGDERFELNGDLARVHWVGAHMRSGQIHVHGAVGRHPGSEMRGGEIRVEGDAADCVGCEMRGGLIHVRGNAGHLVGGAYRGSERGMRGGTIVVDGNVGDEVGLLMQKGTIVVGGRVGNMTGFDMTDGTIIVFGDTGVRPGAGMRGGTIALLGPAPPAMLPSFRFKGTVKPEQLVGVLREVDEKGLKLREFRLPTKVDLHTGDLIAEGSGEIYLEHQDDQ